MAAEIKSYKQYIFKNGQYRKTASGGAEVRVVDVLPTVGEENVLYVLDGSTLSSASKHDFSIKSMRIFIDTSDINRDDFDTDSEYNSAKKERIKQYFNVSSVLDYDNHNWYKDASKYYLEIVSEEIDDDFYDAIKLNRAVLRFDYPTIKKAAYGAQSYNNCLTINSNYKGIGHVGYTRNFSEGKFSQILKDMLIFITEDDLRVNNTGGLYINKKISILDLFKKSVKINIDYKVGNHYDVCSRDNVAHTVDTDDIRSLSESAQHILSNLHTNDGQDDWPFYFKGGSQAYLPDGRGRLTDSGTRSARFFANNYGGIFNNLCRKYTPKLPPYSAYFPIEIGGLNVVGEGEKYTWTTNLSNSDRFLGFATPYARYSKTSDSYWFLDNEQRGAQSTLENIDVCRLNRRWKQAATRFIMVPQFAILADNWQTTDEDAWLKTYSRSKDSFVFQPSEIYICMGTTEETEDIDLVFAPMLVKIVKRN